MVSGSCDVHKKFKKGACKYCFGCRCCVPFEICSQKSYHIYRDRTARGSTVPSVDFESTNRAQNGDTSLMITKRKGKRASALRGKKRKKVCVDSDSDFDHNGGDLVHSNFTPKEKLQAICEILEIDKSFIECPINGYSINAIASEVRAASRAERIIRTFIGHLSEIVCPGNTNFKTQMLSKDAKYSIDTSKFFNNAAQLLFKGNRCIRIVTQSLLCSSFSRDTLKTMLQQLMEKIPNDANRIQTAKYVNFGKVRFASLRKTFGALCQGSEVPKHNYSYRIDPGRLSAAVSFLQESLLVKPGVCRDVKIGGHLFSNMPVYERGGKSVESIYGAYQNVYPDTFRVGVHTFSDLVKLLTKRGESKAGISTYYIQFRYCGKIFSEMVTRILDFPFSCVQDAANIKTELQMCLHKWSELEQFLMWEFSNAHIKLGDDDASHCASFALGGVCTHIHRTITCDKCSSCFTFFDVKLKKLLQKLVTTKFTSHDHMSELNSMLRAIPQLSYATKHYMAHRIRAMVQFSCIKEIKKRLKHDPSAILIVIDHKQKVLPQKYREGQVEYYGKKGMSVLGSMEVRWKRATTADKNDEGFVYKFTNYVLKGYAGQDNVQVSAVLENMIRDIGERYSAVKRIIIQSDNASCFASQDLIPFIFHLNTEFKVCNLPVIEKWIYTEAQTGRGRLDTHFSYLNLIIKSYVEDGNDVVLEEDIVKAMSFRGGVAGMSAILLNLENLPKAAISKKFKSNSIGARATHEIRWQSELVEIYESSSISKPEIIRMSKLSRHTKNALHAVVEKTFASEKPPIWVRENTEQHPKSFVPNIGTSKGKQIEAALLQAGIVRPSSASSMCISYTSIPNEIKMSWAKYPGNNPYSLSADCMKKLKELYDIGKTSKKRKVGAERAHQIVLQTTLVDKWNEKLTLTVPKIKAFFSLTPGKMEDALNKLAIEKSDVEAAEAKLIDIEREVEAYGLDDDTALDNS